MEKKQQCTEIHGCYDLYLGTWQNLFSGDMHLLFNQKSFTDVVCISTTIAQCSMYVKSVKIENKMKLLLAGTSAVSSSSITSHKFVTTMHYEFYEILLQINCLNIFLVIFNLLMDCVMKHVIPGANNFKNVFILSP